MRKTLNTLLKQFSRPFVLRRPFFWIFSSPPTRTVETPYIHAHSAKPILNQNNQTNLTRYVSLSRVLLLLYTVAYGNSIPEETNARFGGILERQILVAHRSSFHTDTNLLSSTNLFRAKLRQVRQVRVFSRSVCSRGFAGARGVRKGGRVWACGFY